MIIVGIDPGLRNTGIAGLHRAPDGTYSSLGVRVIRTEKESATALTRMRSSADDQRRLQVIWKEITEVIAILNPRVIGVENYHVREPESARKLRESVAKVLEALPPALAPDHLRRLADAPQQRMQVAAELTKLRDLITSGPQGGPGLSQAARTIAVYGVALGAAFTAKVPVFVFEPIDRSRLLGRTRGGATKEEIGNFVESRIAGLTDKMAEKVPQKTLKEHAWDANALGILAGEEYTRLRLDVGA